jgi:oxygen-independent coproporphyrinogen-3 oxidase
MSSQCVAMGSDSCSREQSEIARLGLYVHVPFCVSKCHYCDFASFVGLETLFMPYAEAVSAEVVGAASLWSGREVGTIYIGGGTPTVWPSAFLREVLDACRSAFLVLAGAEITCEANPGSVDRQRSGDLLRTGVNRLSLGVQSFDDSELRLLGRGHGAADAVAAFGAARSAGFTNVSLDLIFGLPRQRMDSWRRTLERAVAMAPDHLSLYALSVEEGTTLATDIAAGRLPRPDPDIAADLYEMARDMLAASGYEHYEISNWARNSPDDSGGNPLTACQHNLGYWHNHDYLGFGAGAHSSLGGRRWWNVRHPRGYIAGMQERASPVQSGEEIDDRLAMAETMMLGLRLVREGVTYASFHRRFGCSPLQVYGGEIASLEDVGLLERLPDRIRLSRRGHLLGNEVFARFLPP